MNETKKRGNANLPALILLAVLLMFWQAAAMGKRQQAQLL